MKSPKVLTEIESIQISWKKMMTSLNKIGFDYCIYPHLDANQNVSGIIITENAIAWRDYHLASGYPKYDFVQKAAFSKKIFVWNSIDEKNKIIRKIFNERRDYGMKSGVTIPITNRFDNLVSWFSLSMQNSQKYLDDIMNDPLFLENIYDLHIKTISRTLSEMTGMEFNICYAIVLSHYTNKVDFISRKTGFLVDDLYKLFGHLYLYCEKFDFFNLDIQKATVSYVKNLADFLQEKPYLKCKFSKRQLDCIELIKKGLTVKRGARELGISPRTYEGYVNEIRQKLNCSNQRELMFKLSNIQM